MITIINDVKIYHKGRKVFLAQCLKSGKFVKHIIAKNLLAKESVEILEMALALFTCISANIVGFTYLFLNSNLI